MQGTAATIYGDVSRLNNWSHKQTWKEVQYELKSMELAHANSAEKKRNYTFYVSLRVVLIITLVLSWKQFMNTWDEVGGPWSWTELQKGEKREREREK